MGNKYTREEKMDFAQLKTQIDLALLEEGGHTVFKNVCKSLHASLYDKKK